MLLSTLGTYKITSVSMYLADPCTGPCSTAIMPLFFVPGTRDDILMAIFQIWLSALLT